MAGWSKLLIQLVAGSVAVSYQVLAASGPPPPGQEGAPEPEYDAVGKQLSGSDFDEAVYGSGKNALIKFFSPWCGHCKKMKPDWDKLDALYRDDTSVLIAEVDCMKQDNKPLCGKMEIRGLPTMKYFDSQTGKDGKKYEGGRTFDEMSNFVNRNLLRKCNPKTKASCSEQELAYIEKFQGKPERAIIDEFGRLNKMREQEMGSDKRGWLNKRLHILQGLGSKGPKRGEL
mmetsp:Transcript_60968/g.145288  ORF Transcript_60968/g.145288 Transcript_60968/m.145288 type:complete len:229 (+) Transcript_60968:95-781(+)|eukprot:CAMPEP_0178442098 /NCGR_PEP_ID=MMETSP0689_2-20121128/37948_1 /TAXON_ID=160604 /ORGANISM="Amphidinium massartii, Strain CS-259" /LENGTH=228 /DNA_ID=CAMNT_0020065551 /DNA_START=41 /DNA_END=727 /DNA_ORIENTATION=+